MDPWGKTTSETAVVETHFPRLTFEDNFIPTVGDTLPDSEQYLAILEKKLRDIKNDPNVLKQLAEKREACMRNLLNGETQYDEDNDLDAPLGNSQLIRTILPQKQALNKGEVVELINYDQLENSDSEKESDTNSHNDTN